MTTNPLKVGLYFDLRNPVHSHQDPARLHGFAVDMCEEIEHLGGHSVWASEHHLFDDGYIAAPLTFLSAVAARTNTIRLGTAIVIAPLHHPAELAEQATMVDLISNGRLDLGIGAGYRVPEYELFGASTDKRYAQTDERYRQLRRLLGPSGVTPHPVQDPLPIWMGYQGPQGAARAGRLGALLLSPDASNWEPYRDALVGAGYDASVGRMSGGLQAWVTEDPETDWVRVAPFLKHQIESYASHRVQGTNQPAREPIDIDSLRSGRARGNRLGYFWCDTPGAIAARVRDHIGDAPVETVYFWASIGGMPEEMVVKHVQTVCTKLAPLLGGEPPLTD